jgi:hypothetical protein
MKKHLIPYAGSEEKRTQYEKVCDSAYDYFRQGRSTMAVAKIQKIAEHSALKRITLGRCRAHGLPNPYEAQS